MSERMIGEKKKIDERVSENEREHFQDTAKNECSATRINCQAALNGAKLILTAPNRT